MGMGSSQRSWGRVAALVVFCWGALSALHAETYSGVCEQNSDPVKVEAPLASFGEKVFRRLVAFHQARQSLDEKLTLASFAADFAGPDMQAQGLDSLLEYTSNLIHRANMDELADGNEHAATANLVRLVSWSFGQEIARRAAEPLVQRYRDLVWSRASWGHFNFSYHNYIIAAANHGDTRVLRAAYQDLLSEHGLNVAFEFVHENFRYGLRTQEPYEFLRTLYSFRYGPEKVESIRERILEAVAETNSFVWNAVQTAELTFD